MNKRIELFITLKSGNSLLMYSFLKVHFAVDIPGIFSTGVRGIWDSGGYAKARRIKGSLRSEAAKHIKQHLNVALRLSR